MVTRNGGAYNRHAKQLSANQPELFDQRADLQRRASQARRLAWGLTKDAGSFLLRYSEDLDDKADALNGRDEAESAADPDEMNDQPPPASKRSRESPEA